jgi:diguanylate cyclase (GGDEF)-like protein/excisionase family DNA binding protein
VPPLPPRPIDATLSVTKAARLLGVHPNTVRAWSDAGRLRYYRINPRGDRRYRLGDLQRFMAAAAAGAPELGAPPHLNGGRRSGYGAPRPGGPGSANVAGLAVPAVDLDSVAAVPPPTTDASIIAELASLGAVAVGRERRSREEILAAAAGILHSGMGLALASIWELDGSSLLPRAGAGVGAARLIAWPSADGVPGAALRSADARDGYRPGAAVLELSPRRPVIAGLGPELAVAIHTNGRPWGVLLLAGPAVVDARDLAVAAARALSGLVDVLSGVVRLARQAHRSEALRRVASDLGSRLDLDQVASAVVDHAVVLFEADRASIALRGSDGVMVPAASRGLSSGWLAAASDARPGSVAAAALADRRPVHAMRFRDDPRAGDLRAAVVQEGFDTIAVAPLFVDADVLGLLALHHDRPHAWDEDELDALGAFAGHASTAIRTAENYSQMATWAAQLESIQQLGARLNRMTSVREIGLAIATELRELIDYHNVRVYRVFGEDLLPVAVQGQVGAYSEETPEQLRVRIGEGITGWVAEHKVPQSLPDAAKDPRANTIPGTEDDLDESMLLAPMLFEDQVLGVLVLSKLGLRQFTDDDLRLLVIYASFAAQAMANADAAARLLDQTEAVERQARSQRELLQITESILTTLDPRAVLDQIADRLEKLVGYDNISIEVYDRSVRMLKPLTARGINAADYLEEWEIGEQGIATWVIEHNEPVLIGDQFDDPRVQHFESTGPQHGGLIVVPLRGRDGVTGVLTVERLGEENTFSADEFELVKLFAAQVSIALQNAEVHRAVEIRASTDGLTGLLNHATFRERLAGAVGRGDRFSLVMMDLDDFKRVNDAMGHQAGDRLLAEISAAVVRAGRESDQVFRYGGDEFTLLLVGADAAAAVAVAERVRAAVHAVGGPGTTWRDEGMSVSASFGVATFPDDGQTADSVLLAADRACFVAKRSGLGRVATADEGLALAAEFSLQEPTPVDSSVAPAPAA